MRLPTHTLMARFKKAMAQKTNGDQFMRMLIGMSCQIVIYTMETMSHPHQRQTRCHGSMTAPLYTQPNDLLTDCSLGSFLLKDSGAD